jgi:hypothetical protein
MFIKNASTTVPLYSNDDHFEKNSDLMTTIWTFCAGKRKKTIIKNASTTVPLHSNDDNLEKMIT